MERFTLTPDAEQERAERDWTLRDGTGEVVATIEAPLAGIPYVRPAEGGTYRIEPFGRGWRLAARRTWDEEVRAWYTGRWIRSGGRLLVAPDREYDVRSDLFRRLDLHVRDTDGADLLEARAAPRRHEGADIELDLLSRPLHDEDTVLLVSFIGALELLTFRQGRRLGGSGAAPA